MNPFYADLLNKSEIETDSIIIGTLILPNLDQNSIPYIDSDNTVQDIVLNDGELIIGSTSNAPTKGTLTGTTNQVNVVNGPGSITLSLPQDIATTSSPSFDNVTVNNINGKVANDLVTGPTSAVADRLVSFNSSPTVIKDSGVLATNIFLRDGSVTATGNFNMNNNELQNVKAIRPIDTNVNIGNTTSLSLGGIGQVVIGDFTTSTGNSSVCIGLSNIARNLGVAIGKETYCGFGGVSVGYRSQNNQTDVIHIGRDNFSNAISADIFGVNRTNTTANSLLLGNGSYTNIRANNTCDLGTSVVPFQSIYSNTSLVGTTNTRLVNDIVSNTGTSVNDDLCSFSGTSGKLITTSSIVAANVVTNTGPNVSGNIPSFSGTTGKIIQDGGILAANIVTNAGIATSGRVATFASNKVIQDGGTLLSDLATTAALTAGLALKVSKSGDSMSGALVMGTNNITNVGTISGATNSRTADNIISCTTLPTYGRLPMFSTLNKVIEDSGVSSFNVVTGPASATDGNIASYNLTTGKIIKDSTIASTNVVLKTGTTMVGNIAMGTNSISGTGAITSNTYVANNTISIGTALTNAQLQLSNSIVNRKIILFESTANDHQYYGFGVNTGILRYQVDGTSSNHVFYAGTSFTTSNELMRLTGGGNLQIGTSATAVAKLVVSGGVQNVGGEDSCIRAISALNSAKIELQCTNGSGRLYEFRSLNNGNLDIVDRSAGAGRLILDTLGNLGIAMTPTGGGNNGLFIANGAGPTTIPTGGGALYVAAGRLFYRGSAGTVTLLGVA